MMTNLLISQQPDRDVQHLILKMTLSDQRSGLVRKSYMKYKGDTAIAY